MLVNVVIVWFHAVSLLCNLLFVISKSHFKLSNVLGKYKQACEWTQRQTEKREGATYQHSLLGEKQQHFNTRQNIMVQGPPAAQPNIIHNYCWSYMSVEYLNQQRTTFFFMWDAQTQVIW
jgi:hypothetical protein